MNNTRPCTVGDGEYPSVRGGPFPFGVEGYVTSNFGPRDSFTTPAGVTSPFHYGTDLGCDPPPALVALTDGSVRVAEAGNPEVGNWVRVDAGDGWTWDYYHMADAPFVAVGDEIRAGDVLGAMGSTGLSTAPHLHLGIAHNGINLDPLPILRRAPNVPMPQGEVYPEEDMLELEALNQSEAIEAVKASAFAVGPDGGQWSKIVSGYTPKPGRVAYIVEVNA